MRQLGGGTPAGGSPPPAACSPPCPAPQRGSPAAEEEERGAARQRRCSGSGGGGGEGLCLAPSVPRQKRRAGGGREGGREGRSTAAPLWPRGARRRGAGTADRSTRAAAGRAAGGRIGRRLPGALPRRSPASERLRHLWGRRSGGPAPLPPRGPLVGEVRRLMAPASAKQAAKTTRNDKLLGPSSSPAQRVTKKSLMRKSEAGFKALIFGQFCGWGIKAGFGAA